MTMLRNFKVYQLAILFYKVCEKVRVPRHLQDQLLRASSCVALNLAEGNEGVSDQNQRRFYRIVMGSLRESQATHNLVLSSKTSEEVILRADQVGVCVFGLIKSLGNKLLFADTED